MIETPELFIEAKRLFEAGLSPRQIARQLDILPSRIKRQAEQQNWQGAAPTDWVRIRQRFEQGARHCDLAREHRVSLSTLGQKARREKWSRITTTGLDALRRSVVALETALAEAPENDPVLTMRISTALSMAAGRLARAEQNGGKLAPPDEPDEFESQEAADNQFALAEFSRLLGEWRPADGEAGPPTSPAPPALHAPDTET